MQNKKRRAIASGGIEAIRAAEKLLANDAQLHVKLSETLKQLFRDEALAAGFRTPAGKPNISRWLISLGETAVARRVGRSK